MASTRQIKQQNGDYDLTGAVEVFDSDAISSGPTLCEAVIEIGDGAKDLDGSGGTFELTLQIDGKPVQPSPQEMEFEKRRCYDPFHDAAFGCSKASLSMSPSGLTG